ncbi:nucleoside diphosphate-linked moiety X motif 17-like isoform X1 [Oncorhynchus masou masou]|uniref:nucleoside diphosphate-linked moiety X motif 17-like isoform X1 n=1 Tax=Oncorhynchus masou masou TaxID=90313 RepID=UPI0031839754
MEKVTKILVHLSKNVAPQCARFAQSITGHFTETLDEVEVKCSLENNRFTLCECEKGRGIPLKRATFCPFKYLSVAEAAAIPLDVQSRGVDVGVAILLQSANQKVLLTRRASSLRIFPNVWVPPGGHVELDERLLDAGLRELREETGLKLDPGDVSAQLLGLWESVFPPMLSRGMPQRHHVVTYMLLNTSLTHQQLQASLRPEPAEVSGCLWVDASLVKAIVSAVDGEEGSVTPLEGVAPTVRYITSTNVSEVSPEGVLSESDLPLSVLCNRAPNSGEDVERVSTGTKYALELWLKNLEGQGTRC